MTKTETSRTGVVIQFPVENKRSPVKDDKPGTPAIKRTGLGRGMSAICDEWDAPAHTKLFKRLERT